MKGGVATSAGAATGRACGRWGRSGHRCKVGGLGGRARQVRLHNRRKKNNHMGMDTPLGNCQAWGRCPGIVSPSLLSLPFFLV